MSVGRSMTATTVAGTVTGRLGSLVGWTLVFLIRVYQRTLSPLLGARCRFYPSCSAYAVEAIKVHGPVKGLGLAGWRLLRCHPWNPGGLDPVPPRRPGAAGAPQGVRP
jgi:putative membrane protein insertion efficiency factor